MDYITWIKSEFSAIAAAPSVYIISIFLSIVFTSRVCKGIFSAEAAAKGAQCELLKEKIGQLEGEKSTLLSKLEAHGEDISKIKLQLDLMPKIVVSESEPINQKDGDIWIKP